MPTVTTRYVNTASSGGDGTTNNTSGGTAAYASLSAGLTDIAADFPDFVSSDVQVDVLCTGTTADSTAVTLPTITTDATRFLRIKAQAADKASLAGWSTSKYRLSYDAATTITVTAQSNIAFIRFEDLQIENTRTLNNTNKIFHLASTIACRVVIANCRLRKPSGFSTTGHIGIDFVQNGTGTNFIVVNTLIEGLTTSSCIGLRNGVGGNDAFAYNTMVVGAPTGFSSTVANQGMLKNCRTASCTNGYNGTWSSSSTNNASDIASDAPGSNPQDSISNAFLDAGSGDYRYDTGDGAIDLGSDLSGDATWSFADDMEGTARPQNSVWDIGPFEFVSGGGGGGAEGAARHHYVMMGRG